MTYHSQIIHSKDGLAEKGLQASKNICDQLQYYPSYPTLMGRGNSRNTKKGIVEGKKISFTSSKTFTLMEQHEYKSNQISNTLIQSEHHLLLSWILSR